MTAYFMAGKGFMDWSKSSSSDRSAIVLSERLAKYAAMYWFVSDNADLFNQVFWEVWAEMTDMAKWSWHFSHPEE